MTSATSGKLKAEQLHLRLVGMHDWQFLYDLLAERPAHANISHHTMPDIGQHIGFLRSNPYAAWYIIEVPDQHEQPKPAGSIYLTHNNEIGIQIAKPYQRQGIAKQAIQTLIQLNPRPSYKANIAPNNYASQQMFMNMGFALIQNTYEMKPS